MTPDVFLLAAFRFQNVRQHINAKSCWRVSPKLNSETRRSSRGVLGVCLERNSCQLDTHGTRLLGPRNFACGDRALRQQLLQRQARSEHHRPSDGLRFANRRRSRILSGTAILDRLSSGPWKSLNSWKSFYHTLPLSVEIWQFPAILMQADVLRNSWNSDQNFINIGAKNYESDTK